MSSAAVSIAAISSRMTGPRLVELKALLQSEVLPLAERLGEA
jgi:DNA-binding IclR family transcriptional regulator